MCCAVRLAYGLRAERPLLIDESWIAVLNVQLTTTEQVVAVILEEIHTTYN